MIEFARVNGYLTAESSGRREEARLNKHVRMHKYRTSIQTLSIWTLCSGIESHVFTNIKNFPTEDVKVLYLRITYELFREIGQCFAEVDGAKKYLSHLTPNVSRTCRHAP